MKSQDIAKLLELGLAHHRAGQLQSAEAMYRQALMAQPDCFDALHCLGVVLFEKAEFAAAWDLMRRAIAAQPSNPELYCDAAPILLAVGRVDEAIDACRNAISRRPEYGKALYWMGSALLKKGERHRACECFRSAVRFEPSHVEAWDALGLRLLEEGRLGDAMECFRKAIGLNPNSAGAHNNLGRVLRQLGYLDEAGLSFRRAIEIDPNSLPLRNNLATVLKDTGKLAEAIQLLHGALNVSADPQVGSNLLYMLTFDERTTAAELKEEHRKWNQRHVDPQMSATHTSPGPVASDRRLRIGYVSPDFRVHPVGRFVLPLLARHDRSQFEVFCYSDVRTPDALTASMKSAVNGWRDTTGMPDARVAELIRGDRIDILIDLAMHMADNRMLVFARKPAPVQVTYLAYPGTTGLSATDYRLTDRFLDPPGGDESLYSERSFRLTSYWCYQPARDSPAIVPPPALQSGRITFGCLNNFCKISESILTVWCEVLRGVRGSRLLLHTGEGPHRQRLCDQLAARGIEPQRLEFVPRLSIADYFASYNNIDIALDPYPYAGGTTTCDALWMGVPVVSLAGHTAISRGGLSILSNVGLSDLVTESKEQYVRIAADLAADLPRLKTMRSTMRERMLSSRLTRAGEFVRDVEVAYRGMWREWCHL
jgi:predicted O-linked N-acetylglucosamine transferase (SPINDLY family)